jgi:hypothetical protein
MSDYDQDIPRGSDESPGSGPEGQQGFRQQGPPPPYGGYSTRSSDRKSVGAAALLSLMPGIGQTYAGYPGRGIRVALLVAGFIMILNVRDLEALHPFVGLMLAFTWIFNVIDAARCARIYNQIADGVAADDAMTEPPLPLNFGGRAGGLVLVVVGSLLLMVTLFDFSLAFLRDWWPAGLILLGLWMIRQDRHS